MEQQLGQMAIDMEEEFRESGRRRIGQGGDRWSGSEDELGEDELGNELRQMEEELRQMEAELRSWPQHREGGARLRRQGGHERRGEERRAQGQAPQEGAAHRRGGAHPWCCLPWSRSRHTNSDARNWTAPSDELEAPRLPEEAPPPYSEEDPYAPQRR